MKLKDSLAIYSQDMVDALSTRGIMIAKQNFEQDYLNYLLKNWASIIKELPSFSLYLLYKTYIKDGLDLSSIEQQIDPILIKESVDVLESLCLCITRSNIIHLKEQKKLYMFEEVRAFFTNSSRFLSLQEYRQYISSISYTSITVHTTILPEDLFQLFLSYGHFIPTHILEQSITTKTIEYLNKEGLLYKTFIFDTQIPTESKVVETYHIKNLEVQENIKEIQFTNSRIFQSQIFNDLSRLAMYIQQEGIRITKKDEMSKKSLEKFSRIIPQENILWFLLQFLKKRNFLEHEEHDLYKIKHYFFTLFKRSLSETYHEFFLSDVLLLQVFNSVQSIRSSFFTLSDIIINFLQKNSNEIFNFLSSREVRRSILQKIELLHYIGVFEQYFTEKGTAYYSLSQFYTQTKNEYDTPKPIFTMSSSLQIVGDMVDIPSWVSYTLSFFSTIESQFPAISFKLDQLSVHRALYFGFKLEDLIHILNIYGKTPPDQFIITTLESWQRNFKVGILEEGILLCIDPNILDELDHKPEYSVYIKKRIAPNYALVTKDLKIKKILESSTIYLSIKEY